MSNKEILEEQIEFLTKEIAELIEVRAKETSNGEWIAEKYIDRAVNAHVFVVSTLQLMLKNMEDGYE